jgi:nucleotide-binding universal stress UspA family protein
MAFQATLSRIGISKILLATDFSPESQIALQCALALARRYASKLFLTYVIPAEVSTAGGDTWPPLMDMAGHNAEASMAQLEQREDLKSFPHEVIMRSGDTWESILQVVSDQDIDLVVMDTHGRGAINMLIMGSIAEKVIRHATCPVLSVGPHVGPLSLDRFGHILYATDFSSGSVAALTYALSLAEQDRAELTMLHVIQSKAVSDSYLIEWKRQDRESMRKLIPPGLDLAYPPEIEVEVGDPAEEILGLAETREAELIVMGSHAGTLSTHFPWTTLHHVLQKAPCSVLTVRAT